MAKKGGAQHLQADLQTDEDFIKFIERPGLLVLDVYSAWCGPCLGMVGSLRKIKLELGGDNLQLAICKADTISYLNRFYKKSEPTWLFVVNGRAVNLMFGTNVPKLMKLITHELQLYLNKTSRTTYAITDLQPEEERRKRKKEAAEAQAKLIEDTEKDKKRREYLMYVTNIIMENFPDIGVTVFGPQVNRDMFKKLMEPADLLKMQCKDRRVVPVTFENFETVNFACNNPLKLDVIEQLIQKELLMCFWKIPEDTNKKVPEILRMYAAELQKQRVAQDGTNEVLPPLLQPITVKVEVPLEANEPCLHETEIVEVEEPEPALSVVPAQVEKPKTEKPPATEAPSEGNLNMDELGLDLNIDLDMGADEDDEINTEPVVVEVPKKEICVKSVVIPPIWVAQNQRTHAALIYEFFRSQTTPFLPPDPVPEPPHIIMAFDAYKKRDLLDLAEKHKEDVPVYGFFSNDDADTSKFIASSDAKYSTLPQVPTDKLIFKVSKQNSFTMLSFATYGPSYVSPNTNIGKDEALKFFPEGYKTPEQEILDMMKKDDTEPKKRKKSKKSAVDPDNVSISGQAPPVPTVVPEQIAEMSAPTDASTPPDPNAPTVDSSASTDPNAPLNPEDPNSSPPSPTSGEEGTTPVATTSGEETGESRPSTAEGEAPAEAN